MSIYVDHAARKHEIIVKSIRLFAKVGYKDMTFQKLSAYCGLARTALYRYFRNKRQIFDAAIQETTSLINRKYREITKSGQPPDAQIHAICNTVIDMLFANREFLCVIIDFILSAQRSGHDLSRRVKHYTAPLPRLLHHLLTAAVHSGVYDPSVRPRIVTRILYSHFESTALRLAITNNAELSEIRLDLEVYLASLRNPAAAGKRP